MTFRNAVPWPGVWPALVAAASLALLPALLRAEAKGERRPPARVYTNADLDRVHDRSHETGVVSVPAFTAADRRARIAADEDRPRSRGETYWREEARRVRERIAELADKAEDVKARIAAQAEEQRHFARSSRSRNGRSSLSGPDPAATARLRALELRMRALEDDLLERARRDGALPGWLR